jgi:hypothetical protein
MRRLGNMISKEPDRVNIRKSDRKLYEKLKARDSPLAGRENKDLFFMAMITGYFEGSPLSLDSKDGFVRTEYFNQREKAIIKAISIKDDGGVEVLRDKEKVYSIVEKYAAGGINLLVENVIGKDFASFFKKLETNLLEEYKKISDLNE